MNKKQTIRLNESQLKRIVSESVKSVLKEGKQFPAQEGEFKQDREDLLRIFKHLEEFCKYTDSWEHDDNDMYAHALVTCLQCVKRAMDVMDKTLLFTTDHYSQIPVHWWADNYDENTGQVDYNYGGGFVEY